MKPLEATLHKLALLDVIVKEVHLQQMILAPGEDRNVNVDTILSDLKHEWSHEYHQSEEMVDVSLRTSFGFLDQSPFSLRIELLARFEFKNDIGNDPVKVEALEKYVRYVAIFQIVPYMRELVFSISARSDVGSVILPLLAMPEPKELRDEIDRILGAT
jgi:hypothetical protein